MAASFPIRHHLRKAFQLKILSSCRALSTSVVEANNLPQHEDERVSYPEIKPKYPPGKWGEMEPKYAWLWQQTKDDLLQIPDVKSRMEYILKKKIKPVVLRSFSDHPDTLAFRKYVTKTQLLPWDELFSKHNILELETESDSGGRIISNLKQILTDHILLEHEFISRYKKPSKSEFLESVAKTKRLLNCISSSLFALLGDQHEHLRKCQYDVNVIVRALWDRHGLSRQAKVRTGPDSFIMKEMNERRIVAQSQFDGMLRSHLPLPQFEQRENGLSVESESPVLKFKPEVYGQPHNAYLNMKSILAGHKLGDPCEYGLVGLLSTNWASVIEEQVKAEVARNCRLASGITSSFTWLAAQAYNQGFNCLIDMTYPLTSQTVLSDGRVFSFLAYQLNTLELWKDDDANRMVNLCWHSKEMPLYHSIENGQIREFNDDVLKMLVQMFSLAPADRGYDMKPTITVKETEGHLREDFIPKKVEEDLVEEEEQYIVS